MIARAFGVVAIVSTVFSEPASAASPISEWKIEPSDARCVAVRRYGTIEKPITLAVKAPAVEDTLQLAIIKPGYRKSPVQLNASFKFDEEDSSATALSYPLSNDKHRVVNLVNFDSLQAAALRKARKLDISVKEGINDDFPLGQMATTWSALDKCVEKLRETWNVGVNYKERGMTPPVGDLRATLSADDYPVSAQRMDQQGTAAFLVLIDEQGKARDCTMLHTSGAAILDSRSCGLILERSKFSPALDPTGNPIKSSYAQRINWRLEG